MTAIFRFDIIPPQFCLDSVTKMVNWSKVYWPDSAQEVRPSQRRPTLGTGRKKSDRVPRSDESAFKVETQDRAVRVVRVAAASIEAACPSL